MSAVDRYKQHVTGSHLVSSVVQTPQVVTRPNIQTETELFGLPPAANDSVRKEGIELAVAHALADDKTMRELHQDIANNHDILQAVHETLQALFGGNNLMFVDTHLITETVHEISRHVEAFKHQRATNPSLCISNLKSQIGPGSTFFNNRSEHVRRHHPNHVNTHEKNAQYAVPQNFISARSVQHDGHLSNDNFHQHGQPTA